MTSRSRAPRRRAASPAPSPPGDLRSGRGAAARRGDLCAGRRRAGSGAVRGPTDPTTLGKIIGGGYPSPFGGSAAVMDALTPVARSADARRDVQRQPGGCGRGLATLAALTPPVTPSSRHAPPGQAVMRALASRTEVRDVVASLFQGPGRPQTAAPRGDRHGRRGLSRPAPSRRLPAWRREDGREHPRRTPRGRSRRRDRPGGGGDDGRGLMAGFVSWWLRAARSGGQSSAVGRRPIWACSMSSSYSR